MSKLPTFRVNFPPAAFLLSETVWILAPLCEDERLSVSSAREDPGFGAAAVQICSQSVAQHNSWSLVQKKTYQLLPKHFIHVSGWSRHRETTGGVCLPTVWMGYETMGPWTQTSISVTGVHVFVVVLIIFCGCLKFLCSCFEFLWSFKLTS